MHEKCLRTQLLEVGADEPLLRHFHKLASFTMLDKVALAFERSEVDLLHDLDGKRNIVSSRSGFGRGDGGLLRVRCPVHEGSEL